MGGTTHSSLSSPRCKICAPEMQTLHTERLSGVQDSYLPQPGPAARPPGPAAVRSEEEDVVGLRSTSIHCCADLLTIRSDGRIIHQSIASLAAAEHGWHRTRALLREE